MMNFCNTEEAFVLANVKEFVKIWGSGSQANLNIRCKNGNAWLELAIQLSPPCAQHYVPPCAPFLLTTVQKEAKDQQEKRKILVELQPTGLESIS